ncbi:MAG: hypothetical protein AB1896_22935, partial [Thermodesulfobacteriota bacterium]
MKLSVPCLLAALLLISGCAAEPRRTPTLLQTAAPRPLPEPITLLPALDARVFPAPDQAPNLSKETTILIPAEEIMKQAEAVFAAEGLGRRLEPYRGPLPSGAGIGWPDFPLRGLQTDLAFGL